MAIKSLLACLMDPETAGAVLGCAVPLARAHDAHLTGLHARDPILVYPGVANHIPPEVHEALRASQQARSDAIRAVFDQHTHAEDIVSEWRLLRTGTSPEGDRIIESARVADLVIMPNATAVPDQSTQVQARVIRESGRPVLLVPPDGAAAEVGSRVVLGWSDTREAARAAHDMLQVVRPGATVSLLRVGDAGQDPLQDHALVELAVLCDRHGLRAETVHRDRAGGDVADILLAHAFDIGADLVVTGAFGHSRAYDFVVGAATYGLLRKARMPVLFST